MSTTWSAANQAPEVQRLVLSGNNFDFARFLVLTVKDAVSARRCLNDIRARVKFDKHGLKHSEVGPSAATSIGFTYAGLLALEVPDDYLAEMRRKAGAFCDGAATRAAAYLGDSGASAVEHWEPPFHRDAHVLLVVHGASSGTVGSAIKRLKRDATATAGFEGWGREMDAEHLGIDPTHRMVHFGFRDNLSIPEIVESGFDPIAAQHHHAGELLLGYENNEGYNRWDDGLTDYDIAGFFRNGSFAVLRKIEQDEEAFNAYLKRNSQAGSVDYLKAKLCGRWPDGSLVRPGELFPALPRPDEKKAFTFKDDSQGFGCPFGAHIRRVNPRSDPVAPPRLRPLFRRGIPYGPAFTDATKDHKRGLMGLFFCASVEDQFEIIVSQWIENMPMGPSGGVHAKDPLVGHHDEELPFHIPRGGWLKGPDKPFVTTLGTLYTFFPSRSALRTIASDPFRERATRSAGTGSAISQAPRSAGASPSHDDTNRTWLDGAPSDRFCDIVLEGGVTSGIIYASAISELAKQYRFSSIGGSSIGAFAAAIAAAAEFNRRRGSGDGFKLMQGLPDALAETDKKGRTRLFRLFKPQHGTKPLFEIFAASLNRATGASKLWHGVVEALRQYEWSVLLAVLTAFAALSGPLVSVLTTHGLFQCRDGCLRSAVESIAARLSNGTLEVVVDAGLLVLGGAILGTLLSMDSAASKPSRRFMNAVRDYGWGTVLAIVVAVVAFGAAAGLTLSGNAKGGDGLSLILSVVFAMAASAILVTVALLIRIAWHLVRRVVPNGFGLCLGWSADEAFEPGSDTLDLAGYMHEAIQLAAGLGLDEPPLTFAQLHDAPGAPSELEDHGFRVESVPSINLQVYSTNLTHGRPYRFPSDPSDDMGGLFFRPEELQRYFPKAILDHLLVCAAPYAPRPHSNDPPIRPANAGILALPMAELPILVAARLAMSFPLLISAIPLWAIDFEKHELGRCWLSDGGLCSNFPIHLFDSFVPRWPTFGIALLNAEPGTSGQVWLPQRDKEGRADTWDRSLESDRGKGKLGGFLSSIWEATWRWNDMTMMRMPGVRDRVVRIYLEDGEGGVNIKMSAAAIKALATKYGRPAAAAFISKFAEKNSPGWDEHRWVRFNVILIALRKSLEGIRAAMRWRRYSSPLGAAILRARRQAPLRDSAVLTASQADELKQLERALSSLEVAFDQAGNHKPYIAMPRPAMRVRPPT